MGARRIIGVVAALSLTMLFGGVALATTYATVDGHQAATANSNNASSWDTDTRTCEKVYDGGGQEIDHWATDQDYALVVVKAGSRSVGQYAVTLFANTLKGQVVWADTNGNNTYDPGTKVGDKQISHIIVCEATTTTTSSSTTSTTSTTSSTTTTTTSTTSSTSSTDTVTTSSTASTTTTSSSVESETTPEGSVEELTPPRTDALEPAAASTVSTGLLLVVAGILAMFVIFTPALARRR